ncbi:uncharacterized protein PRCAT00006239001 [Priceomyces carsonii]|uniref:uncharacterized protein n=1 Tax=Priceomyces carsonii TaxID=28549 RepID=UPI002EDA4487|nr:unnamed protein product [Priceomyces carsonii]
MMLPKIDKHSIDGDLNYVAPKSFPIGPFKRYKKNPILKPNPDIEFESGYLYNATAIVIDDKVFLLYRAQNKKKTSSVGLAWSKDGFNFTKYHKPIIEPTESWELIGGCEDPRIVRDSVSKLFIVTYTAFDGKTARLCVATSENLFDWTKYPTFVSPSWRDVAFNSNHEMLIRKDWLKSGAIFTEKSKDGHYYMIWGDSHLYLASSKDLIHWKPLSNSFQHAQFTRPKLNHESKLIEAGPAPFKLDNDKNQWIFFYNACTNGGEKLSAETYSISEMLIDYDDIKSGPIARLDNPIMVPESKNEVDGQVNKVVFCEGIVQFHDKWLLYFGQGDSELGVAVADV